VRAVPRLWEFYPGICLTTEEKARKTLSQGKRNLSHIKKNLNHSTVYILPKTPTHYKTHTNTQIKTNTVQVIPKWSSHNIIKYPQYKVTLMYITHGTNFVRLPEKSKTVSSAVVKEICLVLMSPSPFLISNTVQSVQSVQSLWLRLHHRLKTKPLLSNPSRPVRLPYGRKCINSVWACAHSHAVNLTTLFIQLAVCLTTGPKPLPKRALHIVRSRASSFKWEYPLLSLRSSSSFVRLLPCLPVTSIPPCIFPSITRCRRQFRRKMWPIQFAFRLHISCRIIPFCKCSRLDNNTKTVASGIRCEIVY